MLKNVKFSEFNYINFGFHIRRKVEKHEMLFHSLY